MGAEKAWIDWDSSRIKHWFVEVRLNIKHMQDSIAEQTCGDWGSCSINDGGVEVCLTERCRNTPPDAQHFSEGVLIAVRHLKDRGRFPVLHV